MASGASLSPPALNINITQESDNRGFQSGAFKAAQNSNVLLLDWQGFQELFVDRWYHQYALPKIRKEADPLVEYTEPINSRIFKKAEALNQERYAKFRSLREEYRSLAFFALYIDDAWEWKKERLRLPLKDQLGEKIKRRLPKDLLEVTTLRDFVEIFLFHLRKGVQAFDEVFGGRA